MRCRDIMKTLVECLAPQGQRGVGLALRRQPPGMVLARLLALLQQQRPLLGEPLVEYRPGDTVQPFEHGARGQRQRSGRIALGERAAEAQRIHRQLGLERQRTVGALDHRHAQLAQPE